MQTRLALISFLFFLASCASMPSLSPTMIEAESGVEGQMLIGPTCPVMQIADPCPDKPYQGNFSVKALSGEIVAHFKTDEQGRFKVFLSPGEYILFSEDTAAMHFPIIKEQPFTVQARQITRLAITLDSGIR
jgi:hypothetical protein